MRNTASNTDSPKTPRGLGRWAALAVVAGSMLGVGIFLAPPMVARAVAEPWQFIGMWGMGALIALGGAVACAELGAMMPRSGGDYVIQQEAFDSSLAFASGWTLLLAVFGGSIAALASGLCAYQLPMLLGTSLEVPLLPLPWGGAVTAAQLVAIGLVLALTAVNHFGLQLAGFVQLIVTSIPVAAVVIGATLLLGSAIEPVAGTAAEPPVTTAGLALAYLPIYFAFSGWNAVIYLAGEVRRPSRTIPWSLIGGTVLIGAAYLLACFGFLNVLGLDGLRQVSDAGVASATAAGGELGGLVMALLVAVALVASLNGSILGSSRVASAMARGGAMWRGVGHLHPKRGVPSRALWLQAIWASLLIGSERFEALLNMVSVAMLVIGFFTVGALFVLRRKRPEAPRPFRAFGYPWLPALYLIANLLVVVALLVDVIMKPDSARSPLLGLAILAVTYLVHRLLGRRTPPTPETHDSSSGSPTSAYVGPPAGA